MIEILEKYPELIHYTDFGAVKGILKHRYLRATNYKILNDSKELHQFAENLHELLVPSIVSTLRQKGYSITEKNIEEIKRTTTHKVVELYNAIFSKSELDSMGCYITSFCGVDKKYTHHKTASKQGLLSQWRGYGKANGDCFGIVFDTLSLDEFREKNDSLFREICYSAEISVLKQTFGAQIKKIAKGIIESEIMDHEKNNEKSAKSILEKEVIIPFLEIAPFHKHVGFFEEQEVRAAFYPQLVKEEPYSERAFYKKFMGFDPLKCITRIIVAPSSQQEKYQLMLKDFLADSGLTKIPVINSDIPYRP